MDIPIWLDIIILTTTIKVSSSTTEVPNTKIWSGSLIASDVVAYSLKIGRLVLRIQQRWMRPDTVEVGQGREIFVGSDVAKRELFYDKKHIEMKTNRILPKSCIHCICKPSLQHWSFGSLHQHLPPTSWGTPMRREPSFSRLIHLEPAM